MSYQKRFIDLNPVRAWSAKLTTSQLQQNVAVTAALLEGNIVQDDYEIVSADIEDFVVRDNLSSPKLN